MKGRTYINGNPDESLALHDLMGFVPQDDIMHQDLTVKVILVVIVIVLVVRTSSCSISTIAIY